MGTFAQLGKPLRNGSASLTNGAPGPVTLLATLADEWTDVYSIVITTNDTTVQTVTITDTTTTLTYFVGGATANPPVLDQGSTPVRFKKGGTITVAAGAVTSGKTIAVNIRGLSSKT